MKQSTASKTLLAIVTILTVMMALIVPSPAFAANELPPPPPPPSNDTGGTSNMPSSSSSVKDLPADTTLVVTNNGTPVSLAAQLTVDALLEKGKGDKKEDKVNVKFCTGDHQDLYAGDDCHEYESLEEAIEKVSERDHASGTFFVDINYKPDSQAQYNGEIDPIVVNRQDFKHADEIDLTFLGGVNFHFDEDESSATSDGGKNYTEMEQPFTILNIDHDSEVTLDSFQFTIEGYKKYSSGTNGDEIDSVVSVINSHNVTLKNLEINITGDQVGILVKDSEDIKLKDVTVDESEGKGHQPAPPTNGEDLTGGIVITDSEDISFKDVSSTSDTFGAYLKDNTGELSIEDSHFNDSGKTGLYVTGQEEGEIKLENVDANNNGQALLEQDALGGHDGDNGPKMEDSAGAAFVDNEGELIIKDSHFNENALAGLFISGQDGYDKDSDAFILLENVEAKNNSLFQEKVSTQIDWDDITSVGAWIETDSGNVEIKDSKFEVNNGVGLQVVNTGGDILLNEVKANDNSLAGAILDTCALDIENSTKYGQQDPPECQGHGSIFIGENGDEEDSAATREEKKDDGSEFNSNGGSGLIATSSENILVNNVEVNFNGEEQEDEGSVEQNGHSEGTPGAVLTTIASEGEGPKPSSITGEDSHWSGVSVTDSFFMHNNGDGLVVDSASEIKLDNVTAEENDKNGADLTAAGDVTVKHSEFSDNEENGLNVTVSKSDFDDATGGGWDEENSKVEIVDSEFNNNDETGLNVVNTIGDIIVKDVEANNNGEAGAILNTCSTEKYYSALDYDKGPKCQGHGSIFIGEGFDEEDSAATGGGEDDLSGQFNENGGSGLIATSSKNILVDNVEVNDNGWDEREGGSLDDKDEGAPGAVLTTIARLEDDGSIGTLDLDEWDGVMVLDSEFNDNNGDGLVVDSAADILLIDVEAEENEKNGADLTAKEGSIAVIDSEFNENDDNGLEASAEESAGIFVLDSEFIDNGENGADLFSKESGGIAIIDSKFIDNEENGLKADTEESGGIFVLDSKFIDNHENGADLSSKESGDIDIIDSLFIDNRDNGVKVDTEESGGVDVIDSLFIHNGENGADIKADETDGIFVADSMFLFNEENGLKVDSKEGDITLEDVFAAGNDEDGADLKVYEGDVSVTASTFGIPLDIPLTLGTGGLAALTDGIFDPWHLANGENGLDIEVEEGDVIIGDVVARGNGDTGIKAEVDDGTLTMTETFAEYNGEWGADLEVEGNVDISTSSFRFNGFDSVTDAVSIASNSDWETTGGLKVESEGIVDLDQVVASDNFGFGAFIEGVSVIITGSDFEINTLDGLNVEADTTIQLTDVNANKNGDDGAVLDAGSIIIADSNFNDNVNGDGLETFAKTVAITGSQACGNMHNFVGNGTTPDPFDLDTCQSDTSVDDGIGTGPTDEIGGWQTITVFTDPGQNSGTLSCQVGTTFLYLEKKTPPTPDFEWARAVLYPCIVPGGSKGTFVAVAEGALPGALPSGITFQGKAFDLSITSPTGTAIGVMGGPMFIRFTLPEGFALAAGKKLQILWFDPSAKSWVELTTYAGGQYAWGYASNTGTFALTIK